MANDVLVDGSAATAKVRNPWLVLLFSIVTFGIYSCFWWYFINREMADLGRARGSDVLGEYPSVSVLAFTLGSIVYIPLLVTIVTTNRRIRRAQRMTVGKSHNGWIVGLLWLSTLGFGAMTYMQFELNKVWRAPSMRLAEDHGGMVGDAERARKLDELLAAGALTPDEHESERRRLGLT